MDASFIPAFAGLAGAIIGGVTSFATTWLTTTAQARTAQLAAERSARQDLYGRYMDELATLFAAAIRADRVDYDKTIAAFALRGRITLMASPPVVESAGRALRFVVDLAMGPPRGDDEVRAMMDDSRADVIGEFAATCRAELKALS
jgi:hypothetical protein